MKKQKKARGDRKKKKRSLATPSKMADVLHNRALSLRDHQELHHYTSFTGLNGIVEKNCIWATHYSSLNDSTEITLLENILLKVAVPRFEKILKVHHDLKDMIEKFGGVQQVANETAKGLVESLFNVGFRGTGTTALAIPYIASFCTHSSDQLYERENGLLSQWRAYARDGCCIVFDTEKIYRIIEQERESYYWVALDMQPVIYADDKFSVQKFFPEILDALDQLFRDTLNVVDTPLVKDPFKNLLEIAPFLKHQGFYEEREVRIFAAPATSETLDLVRTQHPDIVVPPFKPVETRLSLGKERPYLELFLGLKERLPIKRVIIAPSLRQEESYRRALELLGSDTPVIKSATPYIS